MGISDAIFERTCCQEIHIVMYKMSECDPDLQCNTLHRVIELVCFNIWSLQIAYMQYRQQYGHMQEANTPLE